MANEKMNNVETIDALIEKIRNFASGTNYVMNRKWMYEFMLLQDLNFVFKRSHFELAWKELVDERYLVEVDSAEVHRDLRRYKWEI